MRSVTLAILLVFALTDVLTAQSPIPVIVPAATSAAKSSQAPGSFANSTSLQAALKMLQELKAANEETLRKQEATLQQLDELEKAAEQLKIYTKRG
jgi:biopolymer transport protein ExbD